MESIAHYSKVRSFIAFAALRLRAELGGRPSRSS